MDAKIGKLLTLVVFSFWWIIAIFGEDQLTQTKVYGILVASANGAEQQNDPFTFECNENETE